MYNAVLNLLMDYLNRAIVHGISVEILMEYITKVNTYSVFTCKNRHGKVQRSFLYNAQVVIA